jgi:hypothetical protein
VAGLAQNAVAAGGAQPTNLVGLRGWNAECGDLSANNYTQFK